MNKKPNLLFIFTDEQAAKTMKAYGNDTINTPNMDKLAKDSIVFKNAYVSQPVCTPSRSTIMTGLYPHTNGCVKNNIPLRPDIGCLPELADFHDYKTAYYGKWHLGDEVFRQHGFDDWRSTEEYEKYYSEGRDHKKRSDYAEYLVSLGYEPDVVDKNGVGRFSRAFCARLPEEHGKPAFTAKKACKFIKENKDNPFVLYVNFLEPHMPYFGPRDDQYDPEKIPLPESFYHELSFNTTLKNKLNRLHSYYEEGLKTEADWKALVARYWGLVSLVDTCLGKILDTVEECGLNENTIIVYTSDHGDMMGAHRMIAKGTMFEESVKVPLILKIPGIKKITTEKPVSQVDLVPTLLDAMGKEIPDQLQGFSWIPFLEGKSDLEEKDVYIEWNGLNGKYSEKQEQLKIPEFWKKVADVDDILKSMSDYIRTIVTHDGWKLCWSKIGENELYNLKEDPNELNNLVLNPEYKPLINELKERIGKWQKRTGDNVDLSNR